MIYPCLPLRYKWQLRPTVWYFTLHRHRICLRGPLVYVRDTHAIRDVFARKCAQVLRQTVVTDSFGLHACVSAYTGVMYVWYGVTWQLGTETTMILVLRCSVVVLACLLSGSLEEEQESYTFPITAV